MPKPNNLTPDKIRKYNEQTAPVFDRISALLKDPSFQEELRKALWVKG